MSNWNQDERDQRQRSYGFIGLSVMAHVGVLALLALLPKASQPEMNIAKGGGTTDPVYMEIQKDGAEGQGSQVPEQQLEAAQAPVADSQSAATTSVEAPIEAPVAATKNVSSAPAEEKIETQEVKVAAVKVVPAAPLPVPPAKPESKPAPKIASKPKPTASKPAPKSEDKTNIVEDDASDDHVRKALLSSRTSVPEDKKVEEAKPVTVADDTSHSTDDDDDDQEDTEIVDEKAPAVIAAVAAPDEPKKTESISTKADAAEEAKPAATASVVASAVAAEKPQNDSQESDHALGGTVAAAAAEEPKTTSSNPDPAIAGPAGHGGNGSGATAGLAGGPRPGVAGIPTGTLIRDASDLVAKPGNTPPAYPMEDRRLGRQGNNTLLARVQADGTVAEVILERSSGSPYMDQAAVQAFKKWKFMPGQAGWIRQPFAFSLSGKAQEMPARLRRR